MGVRGLKSYLDRHCPNACRRVQINALVADHRRRTGNRAEIVVDAHTCLSMWYDGLNWSIGMEAQQLIERLRSFVARFESIDADLVFFIRGLMEKRRRTWLGRTAEEFRKKKRIFEMLNGGRSFSDITNNSYSKNYIPPNMTIFVAYVLKHVLNCKVYVSVDECDEDIIQYVQENGSLAIFSLDTDFIVSNVDCVMLSVCDFNSSEMTTTLYDRSELCKYLDIEKSHLPLFGILAGNDYTADFESLREFREEQCGRKNTYFSIPYKRLFSSLASYVSSVADTESVDELMETVCWDVFMDMDKKEEMKLAYNLYFPRSQLAPDALPPVDAWSQVLRIAEARLRNVLLPVSAWGVLSKRCYESSPYLENLSVTLNGHENVKEQPSATITRPLRRRLYGILLHEIKHLEPTVTEWCGENDQSYQRPVTVQPEYIQVHHPGLMALWDENQTDVHSLNKWILFLNVISPNKPSQNVDAWMNLPSDLVISSAACYYLYMEKNFLSESELLTLLATLAMYQSYNCVSLDSIYDGTCDLRAVKIIMTFDDTFHLVFSVLASCGYPVPLTKETAHIRFEPKLFQHLYKRMKNDPNYPPLYGHGDCIERFNQMYNAIHG